MQRIGSPGLRATAAVVSLAVVFSVAACTSGTTSNTAQGPSSAHRAPASGQRVATPSTTPPVKIVQAAVITASPESAESAISPATPVSVRIAHGKLTLVTLRNAAGEAVRGTLAADSSTWTSAESLGYNRRYVLVAKGVNAAGVPVTKKTTVTTVAPQNMTQPIITDIYGSAVDNDATYGVGMVVRVHFDEQVDKAAAQRRMTVTTTGNVTGGWYWRDDQNAFWRPETYYPTGTKVKVTVAAYGARLGKGLYGQSDQAVAFTIGQKRVSVANAKTHHVKVYFDGKQVRTMPTSMGKGGYEPGTNINFWTMSGTYTVINHENPALMSSASFGIKSGPNYYPPEKVYWSTKISTDGIYLHELDTTVWAQGRLNLSHGCLNLNLDNARWFYQHSRVGDIVNVVQTGGPRITFDQGGQWSVSWADWLKGSALS
ncbi:MAG: Ig-like domain-containing protein [Jatrophihabitans sp.]